MIARVLRLAALGAGLIVCGVEATAAEEAASPTQVDHLNIVFSVTDANAVEAFYGDVLGLRRIADIPLPGAQNMIRYMAGATEVKFIVTGEDLPEMSGRAGDARGIRLLALLLPIEEQAGIIERLARWGREVDMAVRMTESG